MKSKHSPLLIILLGAVLVLAVVSGIALRANSQKVNQLKRQLEIADSKNEGIDAALNKLKNQVTLHMNTPLSSANSIKPPIQLKYSFERALGIERGRVSRANVKVTADAQTVCEQRFGPGQVQPRLACNAEYIATNGIKEKSINPDFYKYDFVSPWWSPDLAGISILCLVFCVGWLGLYLLGAVIIRHKLDN
jgi:hypothetical protein